MYSVEMTTANGYPMEEILLVHEPKVFARLTELSRKELTKVAKRVPLVFDDLKVRRAGSGTHVVVPRDDFERQLHAFTSGVFADWEPSLWSNVLVAGAHRLPHLLSTFGRHLCLAYSLQLFRTRSTAASPGCLSYSSDPHGRWGCAGEFTACRP